MILFRPAAAADGDAIWGLLEPVFRAGETYAIDPAITKQAALRYWMDDVRACYVAERDGVVVGTYYIRTNQPGGGDHICNCGYIVGPQARGKGVARSMCMHSQTQAIALGYRAMQFNFVLSSNAGAVHLWQSLGFQTVGRIPDAFRHPQLGLVDALVMYKPL